MIKYKKRAKNSELIDKYVEKNQKVNTERKKINTKSKYKS